VHDGQGEVAEYICHSLDTYLPVHNSTSAGTHKRCKIDQLSDDFAAADPPGTCQGFRGEEQKKLHWFLDSTGITQFDSSYSDRPQSVDMTLDDFIAKYPEEIIDRDETTRPALATQCSLTSTTQTRVATAARCAPHTSSSTATRWAR
jgi:hypothetical protein